jgi:hypothetical protein
MGIEDAVAAEISLTVDDKRYEFAPLTVRAWGRLVRWAQDEYLATAMSAAAAVPDVGLRQELIDRALVFVGRVSLTARETDREGFDAFTRQLSGISGVRQTISESLLCAKRTGSYQKTAITDDFVDELFGRIKGAGKLPEIIDRIFAASGIKEEPGKNQAGAPA